jgi:hypothetical protein
LDELDLLDETQTHEDSACAAALAILKGVSNSREH